MIIDRSHLVRSSARFFKLKYRSSVKFQVLLISHFWTVMAPINTLFFSLEHFQYLFLDLLISILWVYSQKVYTDSESLYLMLIKLGRLELLWLFGDLILLLKTLNSAIAMRICFFKQIYRLIHRNIVMENLLQTAIKENF